MKITPLAATLLVSLATTSLAADSTAPAASAINSLGIDLLRQTGKADANALLSPYSIETALAMTYAGADGITRDEMARVLHLTNDEGSVHGSFQILQQQINGITQWTAQEMELRKRFGITDAYPITLSVANRLFGQRGFAFHDDFLKLLKTTYDAALEPVDFVHQPGNAAKSINDWVDEQTKHRIHDAIPEEAIDPNVRLVLVDAIYLKAPWDDPFLTNDTKLLPFHVAGSATADVPTMSIQKQFGYKKFKNFTAVTIPYKRSELQFLILLPDATNGLAELESTEVPLDVCSNLPERDVTLYLPKFKLTPPAISLAGALKKLGMTSAFDLSRANFERVSAEKPLYISDVFHATYMNLDEGGTEAAAMFAALVAREAIENPVEVRVDHPFLFAIQHRASGACLFLGHVVDPR